MRKDYEKLLKRFKELQKEYKDFRRIAYAVHFGDTEDLPDSLQKKVSKYWGEE